MLKFSFFFDHVSRPLSGFDLGHCSVEGGVHQVSSNDSARDQSMMLFISIVDLLDGVKGMLTDHTTKEFIFAAAGSSFELKFLRTRSNDIDVLHKNTLVGTVPIDLMASALFDAASRFSNQYIQMLPQDDAVKPGFESALIQFQTVVDTLKKR